MLPVVSLVEINPEFPVFDSELCHSVGFIDSKDCISTLCLPLLTNNLISLPLPFLAWVTCTKHCLMCWEYYFVKICYMKNKLINYHWFYEELSANFFFCFFPVQSTIISSPCLQHEVIASSCYFAANGSAESWLQ